MGERLVTSYDLADVWVLMCMLLVMYIVFTLPLDNVGFYYVRLFFTVCPSCVVLWSWLNEIRAIVHLLVRCTRVLAPFALARVLFFWLCALGVVNTLAESSIVLRLAGEMETGVEKKFDFVERTYHSGCRRLLSYACRCCWWCSSGERKNHCLVGRKK